MVGSEDPPPGIDQSALGDIDVWAIVIGIYFSIASSTQLPLS
jgi:hypothetical protein